MIRLRCTGCDAILEMDDAFAGGVCRCKHCGTIQTVPRDARAAAILMTRKEPAATTSSNRVVVGIGAVMAVLVLLGAGLTYLLTRSNQKQRATAPIAAAKEQTPRREANFAGVALNGPSVIYVMDRGQGTVSTFDAMREEMLSSAGSLGSQQKFGVVFWAVEKVQAWPADGLRPATEENLADCRSALAEVYCFGQSKIGPALEKALGQRPAEIVLATGKAGLDEQFVKEVLEARKDSAVRIHTFCFGAVGSPEALKTIAEKTGGQFRVVQ